MKKILPPLLFALSLLAMGILSYFTPLVKLLDTPFNYIGVAPFIGGLCISIVGKRHFANIGTNVMTFSPPNTLVTDGLFSYSRNPMYLGFCVALAGAVLYFGTLSSSVVLVGFIAVTDRYYIRYEERQMLEAFGDAYRDYCVRVRRWI